MIVKDMVLIPVTKDCCQVVVVAYYIGYKKLWPLEFMGVYGPMVIIWASDMMVVRVFLAHCISDQRILLISWFTAIWCLWCWAQWLLETRCPKIAAKWLSETLLWRRPPENPPYNGLNFVFVKRRKRHPAFFWEFRYPDLFRALHWLPKIVATAI